MGRNIRPISAGPLRIPGFLLPLLAIGTVGALVVYAAFSAASLPGSVSSTVPTTFTVNGTTYTFTYVATTEAQREAGLMNREITATTTMLFAFPNSGYWQFWMYDTNTSLDMIWVNATGDSGRVVYMVQSAPPCYDQFTCAKYTPVAPANYVIEAKAGFASAAGIAVGTEVAFG
jgi:uncharacterized membrane protein (UPF0127 family)